MHPLYIHVIKFSLWLTWIDSVNNCILINMMWEEERMNI